VIGTPSYMAPERLRCEPHDGRADVFSLGILAYEMLAGTGPFKLDPSFEGIVMPQLDGTPVPLREQSVELPPQIETLILAALDREPRKRPTAEEFGEMFSSEACAVPPASPAASAESAR